MRDLVVFYYFLAFFSLRYIFIFHCLLFPAATFALFPPGYEKQSFNLPSVFHIVGAIFCDLVFSSRLFRFFVSFPCHLFKLLYAPSSSETKETWNPSQTHKALHAQAQR